MILDIKQLARLQQRGFTQADIDAIQSALEGFAPCESQGYRGENGWEDWCVRHIDRFGRTKDGRLTMRGNTKAMRVRLPGAEPRGEILPTIGSNQVVMGVSLGFDAEWMEPRSLGGQHLFSIGQGPFHLANGELSPDHIRLDFSPARVPGKDGVGFQYGLRCLVYEAREGHGHRERWMNFETADPVWTEPGGMVPIKIIATLVDDDLAVSISYSDAWIANAFPLWPGQPMRLGDALEWGNFDDRDGQCYISDLSYEVFA